jgi:hypothetical protein
MERTIRGGAAHVARTSGGWIERLGRLGWGALGVVYATLGVLTVMAAAGAGGKVSDKQDALRAIQDAPMGSALLAVVGIGLLGYALWRGLDAVMDPGHVGLRGKAGGKRAFALASALVHGALGVSALQMATGNGGGGGDGTRSLTGRLMAAPGGEWLVALVGLAVLAAAVYQLKKAWRASFLKHLETGSMSASTRRWAERLGRLGYGARGVVFAVMGIFLVVAAVRHSPGEARGLGGALATLAQQPFGPLLLGLVAAGLAAYGVYAFFAARYRRMAI